MIRLIATDLDGTLLDSDGAVPPANRRALEAAFARGVRLVLVTARKATSTSLVAGMIGLPCACITHNGARAWDWAGVELRHYRVPLPLAHAIAAFADSHGIGLIITVDEVNYYAGAAATLQRNQDDRVAPSNVDALIAPPTRMIAVGDVAIEQVYAAFGDGPETIVVHRYYSRGGGIESAVLTHPRATKEDALAELCAAHAIAPGEVLALGDAEADAGMLRWAGAGVAMANGMPEVRAAAQWIAPSHNEAGFAAAINRFILQGS